jgi:hypothetical protein
MPMKVTTVRFSERMWETLEEEARKEGVSVAQFVREAAVMRLGYLLGSRGEAPGAVDPEAEGQRVRR